MKKFLSLVLALVMTMSLVTISAGAKDFTDDSKITYGEAVDVMSAVKVIDGYTDGSFNPSATLTRGAAAKIICNLILGPTTASALVADAAPYKDVPANSTFAGYIAYCAKEGIISGYADGTFKPGNSLTGYAFMKMLLGALGYDKTAEGYEGANWSINVAKRALNVGLDSGLVDDFNGVKAVTREEACLFALNTLKATMVEYDNNSTITVGDIVISTNSKAEAVTCTTGSGNDGNIGSADGKVQFAEKYFGKLKMTPDNDDFGRPASKWTYKTESVGTYADKSDLVATYTAAVSKGDLYTLVGKTVYNDLGVNADLNVYKNGAPQANTVANYFVKNSSSDATDTGNGVLTEVYVDSDTNNTTIVSINTYLVKAVSDYNAKKEEVKITPAEVYGVSIPGTIKQDDFDVADVKEDDYLLVTVAGGAIKSVAPAETVKGSVETFTTNKNVTISGTKYAFNKSVVTKTTPFSIGDDAVLVVDSYGYIMLVDDAVVADNYLFLRDSASPTGLGTNVMGAVYFLDGTYDEVTLKKVAGATPAAHMTGWYSYTKNTEGKYTLTSMVSDGYTYGTNPFGAGATVTTSGQVAFSTGLKANSKTVVLVRDSDNDVTVYTGVSKIPTITTTTGTGSATLTYVQKSGYVKYAFIDLGNDPTAKVDDKNTATDDYLFVLKAPGSIVKVANDKGYMEVEVLRNGEVEKVKMEMTCTDITAGDVGSLYNKVKVNSDGYITDATKITDNYPAGDTIVKAGQSATIGYSNGALTLGGAANELIVGEKTTVTLVVASGVTSLLEDPDASYEVTTGISGKYLANTVTAGHTYSYTAIVDDDGSSDLLALYVYVTA